MATTKQDDESFEEFKREIMRVPGVRMGYEEAAAGNAMGRMVKEMRVAAKFTQQQLAIAADVPKVTIARIERARGLDPPSITLVKRLAHACGARLFLAYVFGAPSPAGPKDKPIPKESTARKNESRITHHCVEI